MHSPLHAGRNAPHLREEISSDALHMSALQIRFRQSYAAPFGSFDCLGPAMARDATPHLHDPGMIATTL